MNSAIPSLAVALALASPFATVQAAKPCDTAEHHQFDFWIGDWNVIDPQGRRVGENRIQRIADGCALLENWTGTGGVTGKSLNIYDATDSKWH